MEEQKRLLLKQHQRGLLTEREYEQRVFELENSVRPDREDWRSIWDTIKNS